MSIEANSIAESVERILDNAPQLDQLTLAARKVSDEDCREIFLALKSNSVITVVDVQGNRISPVGTEYIVECLRVNRTITELNLSNNLIGDAGAQLLDDALDNNHTLRTLHLGLNGVAGRLLESIHTKTRLNTQPLLFKQFYGRLVQNDASVTTLNLSSVGTDAKFSCSMLSDALRRNTQLTDLNVANIGIGDRGAEAISRLLMRNSTIRRVNLANNGMTGAAMRDLGEALVENTTLEWLNVEANKGGDEGARVFINALKKNDTLHYLNMQQNRVTPKLLQELQKAVELNTNPTSLKKTMFAAQSNKSDALIDFSDHGAMQQSARMLAPVLKANTSTTHLNLANNNIGDVGARELAGVLRHNTTLKVLDLANNEISMFGAKALVEALEQNSTVTDINLANNQLSTEGAKSFLTLLRERNDSITTLNLELNDVDTAVLDEIEDAVHVNAMPLLVKKILPRLQANDAGLQTLDFTKYEGRYVADDAAKALVRALKANHTVTKIDFSNNNVGNQGAIAIGSLLKVNRGITWLDLSSNSVGDRGAVGLADGIRDNRSLVHLNLDNNCVGNTGADALLDVTTTNHALKTLCLTRNRLSPDHMQRVQRACAVALVPLRVKEVLPKLQRSARDTKRLKLSHQNMDDHAVEVLCRDLENNRTCTSLSLAYNPITSRGAEAIARVVKVATGANPGVSPPLQKIDLSNTQIGDAGCASIARALAGVGPGCTLRRLNLQNCGLTDSGVVKLLEGVGECPGLQEVFVEGNALSNQVYDAVQDALTQNLQEEPLKSLLPRLKANDYTITKIDLSDSANRMNYYDDASCRVLAIALLNNTHVTKLNLSSNRIGPEGAQCLADLIEENNSIKSIALNGNRIGDFGVKVFLDVLDCNDTLKELWVEGNNVSSEILDELAVALQLNNGPTTLKHSLKPLETNESGLVELPLRCEPPAETEGAMDDSSLQLLCKAMKNNTNVHTLDLYGNLLTDRGADMIAQLLRHNAAITSIDLGYNRITGKGAEALAKAVMGNTSLTYLNVEGNDIPADILHDVQAAVSINVRPPSELSASRSYSSQGGPPLALTYEGQNQSQSQIWGGDGSPNQSAVSHFSQVDAMLQRDAMKDDALLRGTQIVYSRR